MPTPPTPTSGVIRLLNVPFDSGYKNVLDFPTDEEREKYMLSRQITRMDGAPITYGFDNCQYSRRDGTLRVPLHIDQLYNCNYLMFKNPYYSSKYFYCFVTAQRYINDNCTELKIDTDVYSTWINQANIRASFIEREHTNDDRPGANLIPEGLETGEFVAYEMYNPIVTVPYGQSTLEVNPLEPVVCVAYLGDNVAGADIGNKKYGGAYNGIPSSIPFLLTDLKGNINAPDQGLPHITALIKKLNTAAQDNQILSVFTVPVLSVLTSYYTVATQNAIEDNKFVALETNNNEPKHVIFQTTHPDNNNGYEPRNKKLLSYPYCYLGFTAPNGTPKVYRYENFRKDDILFWGFSEVNPNPTVVITPEDYVITDSNPEVDTLNIPQSVTVNGYPNISYRNDYFNAWLAQNSQIVNLSVDRTNFNYDIAASRNSIAGERERTNAIANLVTTTTAGVAGAITGNVLGTVNTMAGGIQSALNTGYNLQDLGLTAQANAGNRQYDIKMINAQVEKQSLLPDTGTLSSSNSTLLGYNYFQKSCFSRFGIKNEYARKIDQYFDMYGYQTNEVKEPNLTGRRNWNYLKTVNINITGRIPTPDLNRLKSVFDNGVTIWHDPKTIYDYSQSNAIIGKKQG